MNKNKKEELEALRTAASYLLAHRLCSEFLLANDKYFAEPEHFFEEWIGRNMSRPDDTIRLWTWRYFIEALIAYRKSHK